MARKPGAGGIILLAVLLGILTAFLLFTYTRKLAEKDEKNWKPVIVAKQDIAAKTQITDAMLTVENYPIKLTEGLPVIENSKDIVGRTAATKINARSPIRGSDLLQPGQSATLSLKVPDGMRAVAIGGDEVRFVGTAVLPGDHVDIIAQYNDARTKQDVTRMILQDVLVLMVNRGDTEGNNQGGNKTTGAQSSMTVAVRPEQTELLKAAERSGTMSVSLRSPHDTKIVETPGYNPRLLAEVNQMDEAPVTTVTNTAATATPINIVVPQFNRPPPAKDSDVKVYRGAADGQTYIVTPQK